MSEVELLAGREPQLKEAEYYLDQFTFSGTAINLALLGERAAGKTSLLNAIQEMAAKRGHIVARVDLTEADVQSPLHFWFKTFDEALRATVEAGGFDGEGSPFYDAYLQTVSGHGASVSEEYRVFRSAEVFAHLSHEHASRQFVHEGLIKNDLRLIIDEMSSGLVFILDECDVLGLNQALLQQFRNVFMQMTQCMVVIAATPDLFPAMSATYSPIIRQFKSIDVGAFETFQDVYQCITQRLQRAAAKLEVGTDDAKVAVERVARWSNPSDRYTFVREVHEASGGLPHQVQLLCHLAFRRLQRGESNRLVLSIEVLEEATREIGLTDTAAARPLHRAITELNEDLRNALHFLGRCSGKATLDQLALVARIADPDCDWSDAAATRRLDRLVEAGLLSVAEGEVVEFSGDSLDRVYARLYARLREERLNIGSMSLEAHFSDAIQDGVRRAIGVQARMWFDSVAPSRLPAIRNMLSVAAADGWDNVEMNAEAFGALRPLAYGPGSDDEQKWFRVAAVHASSRWSECCLLVAQPSDPVEDGGGSFAPLERSRSSADEFAHYVSTVTGRPCSVSVVDVPVLPSEMWRSYVLDFGTPREREHLAVEVSGEGVEAYVAGDAQRARLLFQRSLDIAVTTDCLNNMGYLQFASGDTAAALDAYARAAELDPLDSMVVYNHALALACSGDLDGAERQASRTLELDEKPAIVMHIAVLANDVLTAIEQADAPPGPVEASQHLLSLISELRAAEE